MNDKHWQRAAGALLLTAALSGCAGFGQQASPAQPLQASELKLPAPSGARVANSWWHELRDEQLNQLVAAALKNAPSLQQAAARLRQAQAAVGIAQSKEGPQLDATANMTQLDYDGLKPLTRKDHVDFYTAALVGSWEFDFWGKHHAAVSAALGQQQAIAYEGQQTSLLLTNAVVAQYTQLQRSQEQQQMLDARIRLAQSRNTLTQARVNAGLLPGDSQRGNQVSLARLQQQKAALAQDVERSRHALAALSGQGPDALSGLEAARLGETPTPDADRLTADLLGQRPDIAAQRALAEAAAQTIQEAKAEFYPNIKLTAFGGQTALDLSQLWKGESTFFGFMPAINLPLFHSGQLQSNLRGKEAARDIAVANYNQTVLNALRDAADAVSGWQSSGEQLQHADEAAANAGKAAAAASARVKAGLANKLSLLDAEDAALQQRALRLDAAAGRRLAWANLNTALGGGFAAAPATAEE